MKKNVNFLKKLEKKEKQIKQKLIATVVIFFMFVMVATSIEQFSFIRAATDTANLIQNITGGSLATSCLGDCGFNDQVAGAGINSLCNFEVVNAQDYRGTGAGFSVTGWSTPLANGAGGNLLIPNTRIYWTPADSFFSWNGASNTGMDTVSTTLDLSAARTLLNTAVNAGMGYYNVPNTTLNVVIATTDYFADYNATLTIDIT
ncbi:MAG: hypothetical protein ABIB97_04985 [Patescibacteria group bacterium]